MAMAMMTPACYLNANTAGFSVTKTSLSFGARSSPSLIVCHSDPSSGGGCCGGNGSGSKSEGSCSSHGKKDSLANLGKEFEQLVATNTLMEFEKNYVSAPMEGKITRDIINTVMETIPEAEVDAQKFLDINEILEEANDMSNGDFVFSENSDFVIV